MEPYDLLERALAAELDGFPQDLSCYPARGEFLQFSGSYPLGLAYIASGSGCATDIIGKKIHNHVVKPNASLIVALDHIKGIYGFFSPNDDPGLFPDLSFGCSL